mgnify:CR=1 FL=1
MAEVYTECPNCGYEDAESEELGIYNNGTGVAECLNCGWEEPPESEDE